MIALDRRTGHVLTTIAVYAAIVGVAFVARATLITFLLALMFAYLVEPVVGGLERRLARTPHPHGFAIAAVYLVGTAIVAAGAYFMTRNVMEESHAISTAVADATAWAKGALPPGQADLVSGAVSRAEHAGANAVPELVWLMAVPILAIFFLGNRAAFIDRIADLWADSGKRVAARRTLQQVDRTLAEYARGQLILTALSGLFYTVAMVVLGFPNPLVLGLLGGAMELIPMLGWLVAATAILVSGAPVHAPWVWMALLLGAWRLIHNFVISPRVMGERLQLDSLLVLFAMMVGGQLGGIVGALLSVPAAAVVRILWDEHRSERSQPPVTLVKP